MKKVFLTLIAILLLGTINVKAEESYNILIDENNNLILTDSANNPIVDDSIAKYENNTLILREGKYFNQIKSKHDFTVTSNNKDVYIKELTTKEGNTYLAVNVDIDKLKVIDDETYYFKIDVGGNLLINNSDISSREDYEIKGYALFIDSKISTTRMIMAREKNEEGYGYKITNSIVKCGPQIYAQIGGIYIKKSEIETSFFYSTGDTYIDNSTINCEYFSKQQNEGIVTIKNSKIHSQRQISIYSDSDSYVVTFQNSEIETGEIYIPKASSTIEGCTINSTSDLYLSKNAIIKNTKATLQGGISKCGTNNGIGTLIIEDSDILGSFCVGRSNDNTSKTTIKNTSIKSNNWSDFHSELLLENCNFDFLYSVYFFKNTLINNSKGNFSDIMIAYDILNISNSNLKITNEESTSEKLFPLYVKNDLKINNSNIVIDNIKNEKKAASIQGNLILDDKIIPIDNQNTKLNLIRLEDDAEDRSTCSICYDANKPIYIYLLMKIIRIVNMFN